MSAHKIVEGIKGAIAGNITRVTVEGQTWVREKPPGLDIKLLRAAGDALAAAASDVRPTAPASAQIERLNAAVRVWDAVADATQFPTAQE